MISCCKHEETYLNAVVVCTACMRRRDKRRSCEYDDNRDGRETSGDSTSGVDEDWLFSRHQTCQNQLSPLSGQASIGERGQPRQREVLQQTSDTSVMDETPQQCDTNYGIESMTGAAGAPGAGFFGSSSASVFLEQVRAAINAKVAGDAAVPETRASAGAVTAPVAGRATSHQTCEYVDYELPSRRNADSLVSRYWEVIHPLYPFLLRQTFDKSYHRIWTGMPLDGDERTYLCLLNSIFALSSCITDSIPITQRIPTSKVYFQRARDLLSLTFWESGSIETVQCLLIMAQYLQSTDDVHQCWMTVGQAVRMAQEMGLHLPEPALLDQSLQERELFRRIWHGCILMDR